MDDRRMQISCHELSSWLDKNTSEMVIEYARYTEAEKVLIALNRKKKNRYGEYILYRNYNSGPILEYGDDLNDGYLLGISECNMWIDNAINYPQIYAKSGYPPDFMLGFGGVAYTFSKIKITLDDLLPSKNLNIIIPNNLKKIYDICRPMYIAEMQSEIDEI